MRARPARSRNLARPGPLFGAWCFSNPPCPHLRLSACSSETGSHERRHCLALLPPAGKIPRVRKRAALRRLDRLQPTVAAIQPLARAVRHFQKRKPPPVRPQPRVQRDELLLAHPHMRRDRRDLLRPHAHDSGPAAAVRAALAGVVNLAIFRHGAACAAPRQWCRADYSKFSGADAAKSYHFAPHAFRHFIARTRKSPQRFHPVRTMHGGVCEEHAHLSALQPREQPQPPRHRTEVSRARGIRLHGQPAGALHRRRRTLPHGGRDLARHRPFACRPGSGRRAILALFKKERPPSSVRRSSLCTPAASV